MRILAPIAAAVLAAGIALGTAVPQTDLKSLVYKAPPGGYLGLQGSVPIYDHSYAVVIGVSRYQNLPELPGAVRDAKEVGAALKEHGFEVELLLDKDATRARIAEALADQLPRRLQRNDRVLIYFGGHGVTVGNGEAQMGYLMPVEGDNERRASTGISMREIQAWIATYPSKHVLFAADSCYSGLALATRSTGLPTTLSDYLRQVTERDVRLAFTAGRADQEAHEWEGKGLFTYFFLQGLKGDADFNRDGILTSSELSAYLEPNVAQTALANWRAEQNPQVERSGQGEFIFLIRKQESPPSGATAPAAETGTDSSTPAEAEPVNRDDPPSRPGSDSPGPSNPTRTLGQPGNQAELDDWNEIQRESDRSRRGELDSAFLRKYPESGLTPYVHYDLAHLYVGVDTEKFILHGEAASREIPGLADIAAYLAFYYAELDRPDDAATQARLALFQLENLAKPANFGDLQWAARKHELRAQAFYALGRSELSRSTKTPEEESRTLLQNAANELNQSISHAPDHIYAWFRLGETYLRLEQTEDALNAFARTVALGGRIGEQAERSLEELYTRVHGDKKGLKELLERQRQQAENDLKRFRDTIKEEAGMPIRTKAPTLKSRKP